MPVLAEIIHNVALPEAEKLPYQSRPVILFSEKNFLRKLKNAQRSAGNPAKIGNRIGEVPEKRK